mmetsp:Transcript_108915/g.318746  ORF Transcript_108915/g.318746 Transcript_108915/m.318746 type:complete len:709 (-) Transcript_108915:89-2215(-)
MPKAADIQELARAPRRNSDKVLHEGRSFRDRLSDFAGEFEALQSRYDALMLSNQELKTKHVIASEQLAQQDNHETEDHNVKEEIAQLRAEASRSDAVKAESAEMRDRVASLEDQVLQLQKLSHEREEQQLKAEASATEEARRASEAKLQADVKVKAADERRQAAEARAEHAEARIQALNKELGDWMAAREALSCMEAERERTLAAEAMAAASLPSDAPVFQDSQQAATASTAVESKARTEDRHEDVERAEVSLNTGPGISMVESIRVAETQARLDADAKASEEAQHRAEARGKKELRTNGSSDADSKKVAATRKSTKWADPSAEGALESREKREGIAHCLPSLGRLVDSDWHGSYEHHSDAKTRLFVLPGAGHRGTSFVQWQRIVRRQFPEIEVVVFEYPGHGRHKADLISDVSVLEQEFTQQVIQFKDGFQNYFNCPFAVIGLSAGARFGVNLIRNLCSIGAKPEKFYVVGRSPPLTQDDLTLPTDTDDFLDFVCNNICSSNKEAFQALMASKGPSDRMAEEQIFRADFQMNSRPVAPLPRKWLVGKLGRLIKRPDSDLSKKVSIRREPGSEIFVTGEEQKGNGERWLRIDTTRDNVKPGWWLVNGNPVGEKEDLLELPETDDEPADEHSLYHRTAIPFQLHYSTGDTIAPCEDAEGHFRPMREWGRLTSFEPEFVEHEDLAHDALLVHPDVLEYICEDFLRSCRLR